MIMFLIGLAAGILGGMGIGGGTILIPGLVLIAGLGQQEAQGINLLFFLPVAAVSLVVHIKNKLVDYKTMVLIAAAGIPTALVGAYLASRIGETSLKSIFGIFLIAAGLYEWIKR